MSSFQRFAAFLCLVVQLGFAAAAQSSFPPSPVVKLAVNPVTNRVYMANGDDNTVTALDVASGIRTTIPVGRGASYIAVNPATNRVYVNNGRDASLSVIDGASNTVIGTFLIGSTGPISINPVTNVVYVVRLTGTGSDEVTFFNGTTQNWYTIATNSFQPNAMAINPVTNRIYVAHYATGDVRVISGVYNPLADFPATVSVGVYSHPIAIAANPVTNKVFVISDNAPGPIGVINGADNSAVFPAVSAGHAQQPKALAVNPVTNKAYAAFANEVIVIDGSTNALTYIPIGGAGSGGIALGINYTTNKIFAATSLGVLTVIDGDTNTVSGTQSIPVGTSSAGVNPATNTAYFFDTTLQSITGFAGDTTHSIPLTTTITPFAGNTSPPSGSLTLSAASTFSPASLPVRKVYYQIDSTNGPWIAASGSGPFTASFTDLASGSHTIRAFAADGQDAPLATGPQSNPLVGAIAAYTFTVTGGKTDPTVSLASSANPSMPGQSVTFTASVAGSTGAATGSVTFRDGATALCSAVTLTGGAASCSTSTLASGTHSITAQYSGDTNYNAATSGAVSQVVNAKTTPSISLASSANPSTTGDSVTFTSNVTGTTGAATGTVTFRDGATALCSAVALASGSATCSTAALSTGVHSITAAYSGDAIYNAVTSSALSQTVNAPKVAPSVTLTSSANPSTAGQSVTFTSTVTGSAGAATGTITFRDGATTLCSAVALAGGAASCSTAALASGTHSITAQYAGDTNYNAATSGTVSQVVNAKTTPSVSLASSANPSTSGNSVTFTSNVTGTTGAATGTVTFLDGATSLCSAVAIAGSSASCATAALASGTHSITAQYSGDSKYNAATSAALSQVVNAPRVAPNVSLASSPNPSTLGQSVTFTASVTGNAGAASGTVAFLDGATPISGCSAVTVSGNVAACATTALASGTHSISAQYSGDARYTPGTSPTLTQSVSAPAAPRADVGISQVATPNPSTVGGDVTFTLSVTNSGPATATSVTMFDTLPAGASLVSASAGCSQASGTVTCSVGTLAAGSGVQLSVVVRPAAAGSYTNNASVTAAEDDPSTANNASSLAFTVQSQPTTPPPAAPLSGISTRGQVRNGNDVMIGGFIIGGSAAKTVVVRARGPSLASAGISNYLANPMVQLVRASNQQVIATNDDWGSADNAAAISASGFAPSHPRESAILMSLDPGGYTAIVSGVGGDVGVGIVEIYEVDHPEIPLAGISTRARVLTDNDVMIGGFVIQGNGPQTVVVRGRGPSLAASGISDALANPQLQIVRASDQATVGINDDWGTADNAAALQASGYAPSHPLEAALLITLQPGAYTAIVSGVGRGTGVGIMEVYTVQ